MEQHRQHAERHQQRHQAQPRLSVGQSGDRHQGPRQRPQPRRKGHQPAEQALAIIGHHVPRPGRQRPQHHVEPQLPGDNRSDNSRQTGHSPDHQQQGARKRQPRDDPAAAVACDIAEVAKRDPGEARGNCADQRDVGKPVDPGGLARQPCYLHRQQDREQRDIADRSASPGQRIEQDEPINRRARIRHPARLPAARLIRARRCWHARPSAPSARHRPSARRSAARPPWTWSLQSAGPLRSAAVG